MSGRASNPASRTRVPGAGSPTARAPGRIYYGWALVVALGITELTSWGILYYAISVFLAPMERELGWSRGGTSGAFSFGLLVSGIAAVPIGRWLDRHGARLAMTLGSCAGVALLLAWSNVRDLATFYLIWAGLGVVLAATLYDPAFAVVTLWFRRRRARALTVLTLFGGLASTVFLPLTNWLVEMQGWRAALVTLAVILAVITVPLHALLLRHRPEDVGTHADGEPLAATPDAAPAAETSLALSEALRQPSFRWLALATCLGWTASIGMMVHLVPYFSERGYDPGLAAVLAGLVGGTQLLGRVIYAPFGDRVPPVTIAAAVQLLEPVALVILLLVPHLVGVVLFVLLFGSARGASTLVRATVVVWLYGEARFASISGVLALAVALSRAAGPVSVGAAHDAAGSYDPVLWALVVVSALSGAALLRVRDGAETRRHGDAETR